MKGFEAAFQRLEQKFNQLERDSLSLIKVLSERHYRDSFKQGGFTNENLQRWKPLRPGYRPNATPLMKTGQLRGSIRSRIVGSSVIVSSDREYAAFHNEGLGNNPKRQFLGFSRKLNNDIRTNILQLAKRIFS